MQSIDSILSFMGKGQCELEMLFGDSYDTLQLQTIIDLLSVFDGMINYKLLIGSF